MTISHSVQVDEIDDASTTPAWRTVLIAHAWHPEVRAKEMLASVALSANMDPSSREPHSNTSMRRAQQNGVRGFAIVRRSGLVVLLSCKFKN